MVECQSIVACVLLERPFCTSTVDPNADRGRRQSFVLAAVEEFWNDLKRAHFIDSTTRSVRRPSEPEAFAIPDLT